MKNIKANTGSTFIAETIKAYGVTHVFYLEAVLRETLVEMERVGIKRILTHSEKAAAYMACGFGRISGRPGICMAQSVGAFNLASGIQEAYLASAPVIAISGKKEPYFQGRKCYQEVDHSFFKPVTKFQAEVIEVRQLPVVLRQAFREATSSVPGPVHIEVIDHMGRVIDNQTASLETTADPCFREALYFRPQPSTADIKAAVKAIKESHRPILLAGGGAVASGAEKEVCKLAETIHAPVVTSVDGKGSIIDNHELSIGVCGDYSRGCANRSLHEADLIVVIGCRLADQVTADWRLINPGSKIVQIDVDPAMLGLNYSNKVNLLGDAHATLNLLINALQPVQSHPEWVGITQEYLQEWKNDLKETFVSSDTPIRPERLCREITNILPANAILVSDTGNSAIWSSTMIELTKADQTYLRPTGGGLGWGFPGSLGVKCAAPDRPVICFTGDGGFLYHLCELETAARVGINTVTIVNNNQGFGQCKPNIHALYGDRSGNQEDMYGFNSLDYARIAEAMGCIGIRVEHPDEIRPALEKALKAEKPVVVDVVTDIDCAPPDVWIPRSHDE